ncbi:sirohydrochlorin chelatase [Actinokineospora soli]|uniref:Sirohydrochlorin chelatase n=1 Tax=Actinokineospora soli TaxID=1048753 RepID=A0ABW2TJC2_9PSEU
MLVLAAHGTRSPAGTATVHDLADQVRDLLPEVGVRVAFADVRAPDVTAVLRAVRGPATVVPLFLAGGYHVRVDIPAQVAASGRDAVVTAHLGPAPGLIAALHERLSDAGWRPGDPVVLAAAGSSDPRALADVRRAAVLLGARTGSAVRIGYAATASPASPTSWPTCPAASPSPPGCWRPACSTARRWSAAHRSSPSPWALIRGWPSWWCAATPRRGPTPAPPST